MLSSGTSVAETSRQLGFSYPSHFAVWFSRRAGAAPSRWKRAQVVKLKAESQQNPVLAERIEKMIATQRIRYAHAIICELMRELESRCADTPEVIRYAKNWIGEVQGLLSPAAGAGETPEEA